MASSSMIDGSTQRQIQNTLAGFSTLNIKKGNFLSRLFYPKQNNSDEKITGYRGFERVRSETFLLSELCSYPDPSILGNREFSDLASQIWEGSSKTQHNRVQEASQDILAASNSVSSTLLQPPSLSTEALYPNIAQFVQAGNGEVWRDPNRVSQALQMIEDAASAVKVIKKAEDNSATITEKQLLDVQLARTLLLDFIKAGRPDILKNALNTLLEQLTWESLNHRDIRKKLSSGIDTTIICLLDSMDRLAKGSNLDANTQYQFLECCCWSCELYIRHFREGTVGGLPPEIKTKASDSIKKLKDINLNDPRIQSLVYRLEEGLKRLEIEKVHEKDYQELLVRLFDKVSNIAVSFSSANYVAGAFQLVDLGIYLAQQLQHSELDPWFEQLLAAQDLVMKAKVDATTGTIYMLIDLFLAQALKCSTHPRLVAITERLTEPQDKNTTNPSQSIKLEYKANAFLAYGLIRLIAIVAKETRDANIRQACMALLIDLERGYKSRPNESAQSNRINVSLSTYAQELRRDVYRRHPDQTLLLLLAATLYHSSHGEEIPILDYLPSIPEKDRTSAIREVLNSLMNKISFEKYWEDEIQEKIKIEDLKIEGCSNIINLLTLLCRVHGAAFDKPQIERVYIPKLILKHEITNNWNNIRAIWEAIPELTLQFDSISAGTAKKLSGLLQEFKYGKAVSTLEKGNFSLMQELHQQKLYDRVALCGKLAFAQLRSQNQSQLIQYPAAQSAEPATAQTNLQISWPIKQLRDEAFLRQDVLTEHEVFEECVARGKRILSALGITQEQIVTCIEELENGIKTKLKKEKSSGKITVNQKEFRFTTTNSQSEVIPSLQGEGKPYGKWSEYKFIDSAGDTLTLTSRAMKAAKNYGFFGALLGNSDKFRKSLIHPHMLQDFFQITPALSNDCSVNLTYTVAIPHFGQVIDHTGMFHLMQCSEQVQGISPTPLQNHRKFGFKMYLEGWSVHFPVHNRTEYFETEAMIAIDEGTNTLELKDATSPVLFQIDVNNEAIGCIVQRGGLLRYYGIEGGEARDVNGGKVVTYEGFRVRKDGDNGFKYSWVEEAVFFKEGDVIFYENANDSPGYIPKPIFQQSLKNIFTHRRNIPENPSIGDCYHLWIEYALNIGIRAAELRIEETKATLKAASPIEGLLRN